MSVRFSTLWLVAVILTLLGLLVVTAPYLGSAWYTAAGVRRVVGDGDLPAAVESLEAALRLDGNNLQAYRWLTRAYLALNAPEKAATTAQQALALAPTHLEVQLEAGDVYDRLGDAQKATLHYEQGGVGDRLPQLLANYLRRADQLWAAGDRDGAAAIWRDKVLGRGAADLYASRRLAEFCKLAGQAGEDCPGQVDVFPAQSVNPSADVHLLAYQAQALGNLIRDGEWPARTKLNVLAYLAWRSNSPETGDLLRTLTEMNPGDADLYYYLGEFYRRQASLTDAERAFGQAIALAPEYTPAYLRLGMLNQAYYQSQHDATRLKAATDYYGRYHEMRPLDPLGLKKMADACEMSACGDSTWQRQLEQHLASHTPRFVVNQALDDGWLFEGYDVDEERLARDEPTALWLYWQAPEHAVAGVSGPGVYQVGRRWVQVVENAQNLVANGSFEVGSLPLGLPADAYQAGPDTRHIIVDARGDSPTNVAVLANTEQFDQTGFVSNDFAVRADTCYLQGAWIRGEDGNAYLGQSWRMGQRSKAQRSYVIHSVSPGTWQHYAGVAVPPSGARQVRVWLSNHRSEGTVFFDNVIFVEIDRPGRLP